MDWHLDRLLKLPDMTVVKVQEIGNDSVVVA